MQKIPVLALAVLPFLLAACPEPGGGGGGVSDAGPVDAGAAEDAGPPARVLVERRLFGDMPLDNRVLDPNLTLTGYGWFVLNPAGTAQIPALRQAFAHTPTGQGVLAVEKGRATSAGVVVAGLARGGRGPLEVSVWVGRPKGPQADEPPAVSIAGYDPASAADVATDLAVDAEASAILDGTVWRRYAVRLEGGLAGWTLLTVEDHAAAKLLLTGPAVVRGETLTTLVARPPAPKRALRPSEAAALARVRAGLADHLSDPTGARLERGTARGRRALEGLSKGRAGDAAGNPGADRPF